MRKRIEEVFGWFKASTSFGKTKFRRLERVRSQFTLALAAYNLVCLSGLLGDMNRLRQPNLLPFSASWRCYPGNLG